MIDLDPHVTGGPIDLQNTVSPPLPDSVLTDRSGKYDFALGDQSPGPQALYQQIQAGRESSIRESASLNAMLAAQKVKQHIARDIIAGQNGQPLDEDTFNALRLLSINDLPNPDTILEKNFATELVKKLYVDNSDIAVRANAEDPIKTNILQDVTEQFIAKRQLVQKTLEDNNHEWDQESFLGKALDFGETLIPFKSWYNTYNAAKATPGASFLPGSNLGDQVDYLWSLPVDEFNKQFQAAYDDIKSHNPLDAQYFAQAVLSYTGTSQFIDNAMGVADLASVLTPGLKAGAKAGFKAANAAVDIVKDPSQVTRFANALKGTIKSIDDGPIKVEKVLASAGKTDLAGMVNTVKELKARFQDRDVYKQMSGLNSHIPTIFDPSNTFFGGGYKLAREQADRVLTKLAYNANNVLSAVLDRGGINRLSDEALSAAYKQAEDQLAHEFPSANNALIDVVHIPPEQSLTNNALVEFHFGRTDGSLFKSQQQAASAGRKYGLKGFKVSQQGDGYYIRLPFNIDETTNEVKDHLIDLDNAKPETLLDLTLNPARSAEDVLSTGQRRARKASVHGPQELYRLMAPVAQDLALGKQSAKDFRRFLEHNRDFVYTDSNGNVLRGREFINQGAFEQAWMDDFNRLPTEKESLAYHSYNQLYQADYLFRNFSLYSDKVRQGVKSVKFGDLPAIEARPVDRLPTIADNVEDWTAMYLGDGDPIVFKRGDGSELDKAFGRGIDSNEAGEQVLGIGNRRIFQVYNPVERPLGGNRVINFVISKNFTQTELDFKQIPYRPGGHVEYMYGHYVKQPNIARLGDRRMYLGDTTLHPFHTAAEAKEFAGNYNTAAEFIRNGDVHGFTDHVSRTLPYSPERILKMFEDGTLDINTPVQAVQKGRRTIEDKSLKTLYPNLEDQVSSSYNLSRNTDKTYAGQRDLDAMTIRKAGTESKPLMELAKPKLLDPLSTIQRSVSNMMRSQFIDDYKIKSIDDFVEMFGDVLNGNQNRLRLSARETFFNPSFRSGADPAKVMAAKTYRQAVMNLLGNRSDTAKTLQWTKNKILDSVYSRLGQGVSNYLADNVLFKERDPVRFMRSMAFHTKLGLFNPVQVFVQGQAFAHTFALAPGHALQGAVAGLLSRYTGMASNPAIMDHMAGIAEKFGWKGKDFKEMLLALKQSGIYSVEGEHAFKDDLTDPRIFKSGIRTALDFASVFFTETERFTRLAAFATAYHEWRAANPAVEFSRRAMQDILLRQDTMTVNMTRASNAAWQKGFLSVPTQFFNYQIRLAEQLLGSRLSVPEKARVFGLYATLYGVGAPLGAATVWPWTESIRQYLLDNGMAYDNKVIEGMSQGLPSVLLSLITGKEYNIGERLGPGGISDLREAWYGDKTLQELAFGASGSVVGDIINSMHPVYNDLSALMSGQGSWSLTGRDIVDALSNVSTVNNIQKLYYGVTAGKMVTKGEVVVDNVSTWDALFAGITGLQPQEIADVSHMIDSMNHKQDAQKTARNQAVKYFRIGFKSASREDMDAAFKQAYVWLKIAGFRPDEVPGIYNEATKGYEQLVQSIESRFYRDATADQAGARYEQFIRQQQQ